MLAIVGLFAYLLAFFVTPWIDYWWSVALLVSSPLIATAIAFKDIEYWPAAHPVYGFYWVVPGVFAFYASALSHPREWGQWLGWALLISIAITAVWTLRYRRYIDREWAVFGTLAGVFVFVAFSLNVANAALPWQQRTSELASIVSSSPGGYRQPARLTVSTVSHNRETFFPGWKTYFSIREDDAVCVRRYSGGLGWGWTTIAVCTDAEIEETLG